MKIILHGFGSYPILFRHLIGYAAEEWPEAEWSIALGNSVHLPMMTECLPPERILDIDAEWSAEMSVISLADVDLSTYHGNIYADIEAEKRMFKHRPGDEQLRRAAAFYRILKRFFVRVAPDMAVISQIEGIEGKIFAAVARELNVPLVVPYPCRNVGGYFLSEADEEEVPRYAVPDEASRVAARNFLAEFRARPTPAANICMHDGEILSEYKPPFVRRVVRSLWRTLKYPTLFELDNVRAALLNNFLFLRNFIWGIREWWNLRFEHAETLEALPRRFVYFPLQYSPESSINSPAPFFIDQVRVIDAIRFAMPSDMRLVVKEHPTCLRMRPPIFYRRLQCLAGVVLASPFLDSRALVKRAEVTVSVTGTPIFEAFLYGRPAISLGGSLVAKYIGGITPVSALAERLVALSGRSLPDEVVLDGLAEIFSARNEIVFRSPGDIGEPVLRESNVRAIVRALKRHAVAVGVRDM